MVWMTDGAGECVEVLGGEGGCEWRWGLVGACR